ncbi:sensor histidine kinase [Labedaea rhizosphaerae]|uniref:histidine kinase n=1 Tax=Labedaea rhizosphaerae TaxID=598644 RepID=A0A4R6SFD7_LABRH|nr:histidine kinase [Labedaea rhizosphaerae]TDP97806.1 signal transduction histidine kinase [Labedaea rhizosphaerae]
MGGVVRLRDLPEWQQDAVIVAGSVAIGVLLYLIGLNPLYTTGPHAGWLHPVVFGCLCVVELFRRRAPLAVLAVGGALLALDGVFGLTMPVLIVFADLLYAATLYGPRRVSWEPLAALGTVVAVGLALLVAPDWRTTLVSCLAALPIVVVPVWWAANVRQHHESVAQLARIAELDRVAAVAATRAQMARDLHDVIAGHLSAIALQSEAALSLRSDLSLDVLRAVRENSLSALDEMRAMIQLLRSSGGEDAVAAPARLAELSALFSSARAGGMSLSASVDLGEGRLPAAVDLAAYRIVQEALTNAMKHAPGAAVRVEVRCSGGSVVVFVANDLTGAAVEEPGIGLLTMKERAEVVGGSLTAGRDGARWRVQAELPVEA